MKKKNTKKWTEEKVKDFSEYQMINSFEDSFEQFAKGRKIIDIIPVQIQKVQTLMNYLVRYREEKGQKA